MTGRPAFYFLIVWFSLAIHVIPAQGARMPRGSFLREPAHSATQLASQIRRDPVVASRYERHFGVPAAQFANYAQSQLGLRHLKGEDSYRVFFIKKDGTIGSSVRRLRKGTAVFIHLRTGKAVLLAECGNPMGTRLPGYAAPSSRGTSPSQPPRTADAATDQMPEAPLPPPVQSAVPESFEDPALVETHAAELPFWQADVALSMPELPAQQGSPAAYAAPTSLTPLLLVGASGLVSLGGGGSGRGGSTPPPAVPEPGSLLLWAVGGGALVLVRRRRRS